MRTIKFRAWNKDKKIMVYNNEDNSADYWDSVYGSDIGVINYTLWNEAGCYDFMQFMGTKDCDGVELYERDIIKMRDHLYLVEYKWHFFGYSPRWMPLNLKEDELICSHEIYSGEYHIIGNVYENHHLLGKLNEGD